MISPYKDLGILERLMAYSFVNPDLLQRALSHKSYQSDNNERFEFLGDSILNFVIAEFLFSNYAELKEGDLSRIRANLVKGETLALIAKKLALKDYIRLGAGELKSGGFNRPSILADAVEAIIAAVYLDSGFEKAQYFVLALYADWLNDPDLLKLEKDPKTGLQEFLQSRKGGLPSYQIVDVSGDAHDQMFKVSCIVEGRETVFCKAKSRRKAEQKAAAIMLASLQ